MKLQSYLKEDGGNAIKNSSRINAANFDATVDFLFEELPKILNIFTDNMRIVGSGGKKTDSYGDIDIALAVNPLALDINEKMNYIKERLEGVSPDIVILKGLNIVSFSCPIINIDGLQEGEFVQVDLMLTYDLEFSEFAYYSPTLKESKWKSIYRQKLMCSLAKFTDYRIMEEALNASNKMIPIVWERLSWSTQQGLLRKIQNIKGVTKLLKHPKTTATIVESRDPDEIAHILLGPNASRDDLNSFESIYSYVKSSKFYHKSKRDDILEDLAKDFERNELPVPEEIRRYL